MSKLSDPVVVGTDGSEAADRAVEWAADEAARRHRRLHIVHAAQPWVPVAPMMAPTEVTVALEEAGKEILEEARELACDRHPELKVTTQLVLRSPGYALSEQARSAFEIVIGHRGVGGFSRLLLGSTGLRVAGHVPGPVVIVRGDAGRTGGDVVVGVDPGGECRTALEYAFDAAALRGSRLRVVHGWRPPAVTETGYAMNLRDAEEEIRWALIRATAPLRKSHPDIEVVEEVAYDHPVAALTDASRTAGLVVVGARDRHGLGAIRIGSVSHGVIHHADCPVAVVRPRS
ncbi:MULTISPECIES: universal stress protein [Thermomonospora]|uniref:UspA domain protein n=1 Tax=Thermomonospora curvata (strain ATCC 19995 / DSM 43183 / JCM 3096 / KCTC 9072 / NBRC 15933 / NCIMB 10081 / Henssen B9) TaxID=471852 RepID=D1ABP6_THECD|nr:MULTISPECIES: universal stress protein [Thermomonospora]ACY99069.1 UspA domain protein [Thermomonospora curvata DSM 43183]PKK13253.1 MAG: universal stress protein [Thermomonospora sp. CIF 1]